VTKISAAGMERRRVQLHDFLQVRKRPKPPTANGQRPTANGQRTNRPNRASQPSQPSQPPTRATQSRSNRHPTHGCQFKWQSVF
jgi:hypothetical protein